MQAVQKACKAILFSNISKLWLVTPSGFEPLTCRLGGGCSIQLSYGAIECHLEMMQRVFKYHENQSYARQIASL